MNGIKKLFKHQKTFQTRHLIIIQKARETTSNAMDTYLLMVQSGAAFNQGKAQLVIPASNSANHHIELGRENGEPTKRS
jgi:hypothetical protein